MKNSLASRLQPHPKYKAPKGATDDVIGCPETQRALRVSLQRKMILDFIEWVADSCNQNPGFVPHTIGGMQMQGPEIVNAFFGLDAAQIRAESEYREEMQRTVNEMFPSNGEDRSQRIPPPVDIHWVQPGQCQGEDSE